MRPFALLCVGFIAVPAMATTSARADNCQLKLVSSLTLTETGDDLLVPVTIAGKELKLKLELGGAYSGITTDYAKQLSLAESPMPREVQIKVEGEPITNRVTVPEIQIGRLAKPTIK